MELVQTCCIDLIELPVGLEPTKGFPKSFADFFLCRSDSWQLKLLNITIFIGDVPPAMLSLNLIGFELLLGITFSSLPYAIIASIR